MRIALFFTLLIFLYSCSEGLNGWKKPDDLIPRDTMVMVLKDLSLIEAHIQNKYNSVDQYHKTMILSGNEVLKQYHISRNRLERSMDYYGSHQKEMVGIYTEILDSLNKDASKYDPSKMKPEDSLSLTGGSIHKVPFLGRPGK